MLFLIALIAPALLLQQTPSVTQTAATAPVPVQSPVTAPQTEPTTPPTVNVEAAPAEPTVTCRNEPVTGSRFGRRVCRSAFQTAAETTAGREMLVRMQGARLPDSN